jgi:hypothetical protein
VTVRRPARGAELAVEETVPGRPKKRNQTGKRLGLGVVKPRVPLPRQTGGVHEDRTKRPWRRRKHKKEDTES